AAILFRYFDGLSLRDVGTKLGLAENSARMRVDRALEKLRRHLARRGIVSTAAALGSALATQPAIGAPPGLAAATTVVSLASASATGTTFFVFLVNAAIKQKALVIATAALLGIGMYFWADRHLQSQIAAEEREQNQKLAALRTENRRLRQERAAAAVNIPTTP